MRLKAEIWVKAYIRRCAANGAQAVVARHGDDDAGAIFIRVSRLDGTSLLYGPAPAGMDYAATDRQWTSRLSPNGQSDQETDAYLARETRSDPDLWLVEVEDREGRHFLAADGEIVAS